jgi:hypothetical protein
MPPGEANDASFAGEGQSNNTGNVNSDLIASGDFNACRKGA